jgi:hypothetical protein
MSITRVCYVWLALLVVAEAAAPRWLYHEAGHVAPEDWPAFGSIYGLASCVAIIVLSKLLGKLWLTRPENYYER